MSPRLVGNRARIAYIFPETNGAVEHDLRFVPRCGRGVTFHVGRIPMSHRDQRNPEEFLK